MYTWREVSVDGDVYTLRETRSSTKRGSLVYEETNQLQDGTLIDLCGATLLWRSADGLQQSPSRETLEQRLDELNAGKPQCPVNLNTLVIPRKKCFKTNSTRQPYVRFLLLLLFIHFFFLVFSYYRLTFIVATFKANTRGE